MENNKPTISFVSPVYKAEHILEKLVIEIEKVMQVIDQPFEVILVDDRSPDNGWNIMKKLAKEYESVKSIRLSKNFGQHPAIMAGLSQTNGEWVVVLDCDLQDQPKEVLKLYSKVKEGYDFVRAKRTHRKDDFIKIMSSKLFSKLYYYLTDVKFDSSIANFGIYNYKVIYEVLKMNDKIKSFPLFVSWVGFKGTKIEVEHSERDSGKTSYTWSKLLSLAFNTIISFSNKPLKLMIKFGIIISFLSLVYNFYIIYKSLMGGINVSGYSSIAVSIWFLSGTIIMSIGIVGVYIGKIFDQTKDRKCYIIDKYLENEV